jgi:glycosyltransferase involved in cell wall biosynthesis
MKKIVYLINSLGKSGGMERVLSTKANWLVENNYNVTIITELPLEEDYFFEFNKTVNIESLNLHKPGKNIVDLVFNTYNREFEKRLKSRLFKLRPDITISMFGREYEFLHKINDGSKKVLEFHFSKNYLSHLMTYIPNLSFRRLRIWQFKCAQYKQRKIALKYYKVILLTKKDQLLWNNTVNSWVIPNPVSFITEQKSSVTNKQIVAIGRFTAQKGFDLLIKSYSMIAKKMPDWRLIIMGEGQDEEYLKKLIGTYNLTDIVILQPSTKQVKELLLDSSILVFPSRYEGFGLVLTEAMECGVPCIAFDCECGPSEIIQNEVDGYLIPLFDIDIFAKSLLKLMKDENLRKKMGENAKQNVKRFHNERIMSSWVELFNESKN